MKIALIEKCPSKTSFDFFDFEYDHLYLSSHKVKKLLKKDIDLDIDEVNNTYDLIITVGADPTKYVAKTNSVTTNNGTFVDEKYVPMINPAIAIFKPDQQAEVDHAVNTINKIVTGDYNTYKGDYYHLTSASTILEYLDKVLRATSCKYIAVDTETAGLYPRKGHILGISISHRPKMGVYIDADAIDEDVDEKLRELFAAKTCVFHNAKFDMHMLKYWMDYTFDNWEDTMFMHYLLNENEPHGLKYLAAKYTDMGNYEAELDEFKKDYCRKHKIKQADFTYDLIPSDILAKYAAADTDATITLYEKFKEDFETATFHKTYQRLMKPAMKALMFAEDTGVPFSISELNNAQKIYAEDIEKSKNELYKYQEVKDTEKELNVIFNPNSVAHLKYLLFNKLKLPIISRTEKGEPSTDKNVLSELSAKSPICKILLEIRQKTKILSTYLNKALVNLDPDNRLRSSFNQTVATSGRLSSSGTMNFQQMPRDDKTFKNCISHPDPDWYMFSQDLGTAEVYVAAVLSDDEGLKDVFRQGGDLHSTIAKMVFKIPVDASEIKGHPKYNHLRQAAKAITFGIKGVA